jgi:chorismate-pyruvate lyase
MADSLLTRPSVSPTPLWEAPISEVLNARAGAQLSGAWKLLLLGDGSPTRHLHLLTGKPVTIDLISMGPEQELRRPGQASDITQARPAEVSELVPPLLLRQVWLRCNGQALAWAESWWNQAEAEESLRDRQQPIWLSLTSERAELFREVDGLAQVNADWLERGFAAQGPFWSRHYRFFRQGRELTVIREVFSPALERWLGPSQHNADLHKVL